MSWPVIALVTSTTGDVGGDGHLLGDAAELQGHAERDGLSRTDEDLLAFLVAEAGELDRDLYCADGASASSTATPSASVTVVRLVMVSGAAAVTVTPGRRPPSGSLTTTVIVPVLLTCALATPARARMRAMKMALGTVTHTVYSL